MDLKELTDLLVTSSQRFNQTKFIPWWDGNHEDFTYQYEILPQETVQDAENIIAACGQEELLSPVGDMGLTLFHLLVWHHFYEAVEKMLCDGRVDGGNVNLPDYKGHGLTPFLLACSRGNLAMVRLLLEHGATDSLSDKRGMNAFHFLAYPRFEGLAIEFDSMEQSANQRGEIARLLTCDINQKNENGLTPLELLLSTSYCSRYTWPLTEVFLDKGAKTDYVDQTGNTLLMLARINGHNTAALQLMKHCPELLDVAGKDNMTPLQHAIEYRNQAMYLALLDHGATPVTDQAIDLFPLSQITSNVFCDSSSSGKDNLSIALYMTQKLISQIDPDDDDELGELTYILNNALITDSEAHVLDLFKDARLDFTIPIHYHGDLLCLRDECLHSSYGVGVVRKLTELGVDMDKAVVRGRTPAYIIASGERHDDPKREAYFEEAARLLSVESMERIANSGEAAVHIAAKYGHTGMLKVMIEKGVDVNLTQDEPAEAGITALHCACDQGHVDAVKLLIAAGGDDTRKNLKGETPAHFAVKRKNFGRDIDSEQRANLLKELKNLDLPREDGKTPLLLLNIWDAPKLLPIFLERGVNVNHADNAGKTALMLYPSKDIAKELLRAGADLHMADIEGNTALHYALKDGAIDNARYLIKKGADYNRANNRGVTPVQIAVEEGYDTVLELMTDIR